MSHGQETKEQLHAELAELRERVAQLEAAEAERAQTEKQYRSLLEACPDAVMMSDLEGRVLFISPQTYRLLGLSQDTDVHSQSLFDYIAEEERERMASNILDLTQVGVHQNNEYRALRQDGTPVAVEVSSAVIRDDIGQPKAAMAVIRDITERKRSQEALQREHQTLWHMFRSSDHERQLIAYEIHDGLAQQLAAALMQFQAHEHLQDREPVNAKIAYDAGVQMIRQAHFEARRLISGVRPPILDESGIVAALAHLVHDERMIGNLKIEFQSDVTFGRLAPVLENAIYRIAQEALANACKHSRSKRVRVRLFQVGEEQVRLEVRDWGVGFHPQNTGQDSFGLEGIRERARLLGGEMTLETRPEEGTSIHVVLPLLYQEPKAQ